MDLFQLKSLVREGHPQSKEVFHQTFQDTEQLSDAMQLRKLWAINENKTDTEDREASLRIAITGGGTLEYLSDLVRDALSYAGETVEIYTSNYGEAVPDLMNRDSALCQFEPDFLIYVTDSMRLWNSAALGDDIAAAEQTAAADLDFLLQILDGQLDSSCEVLVLNAIPPNYSFPGTQRLFQPGSSWRYVQLWNHLLVTRLKGRAHLVDICFAACQIGLKNVLNIQQWLESKVPFCLDFHVEVAKLIAETLLSTRAADKKVMVIDCDNTIWGGVVGDDGIEGIEVGSTSARGQGYMRVQEQLKALKDAGMLLAVASKNQEETVMEVFRDHPEMILRPDDIVSFKVNWEPKAENIALLAEELNLGLDSFVFLDDNPAEIEVVRQFVPEVETLLASMDPAETYKLLLNEPLLHRKVLTKEDADRTRQYRAESHRKTLQSKVGNYDEYLSSLEMKATINLISALTSVRAAQLINKSNQFNLTTVRRTESEVTQYCQRKECLGFTVRLQDKFDDQGIIAVILVEKQKQQLIIETFVMSCRVLKRGVEQVILNALGGLAVRLKCTELIGVYRPTKKNVIVEKLYEELGFSKTENTEIEQRFSLSTDKFQPANHQIQIVNDSLMVS